MRHHGDPPSPAQPDPAAVEMMTTAQHVARLTLAGAELAADALDRPAETARQIKVHDHGDVLIEEHEQVTSNGRVMRVRHVTARRPVEASRVDDLLFGRRTCPTGHRTPILVTVPGRTRARARGAGRPAPARRRSSLSRDDGDDGPGEPPPPRLTLAARPGSHYWYAALCLAAELEGRPGAEALR